MAPAAKKKRSTGRTVPRTVPALAEVVRIPLPKPGGTRRAHLDVPSLTVVYGAAVVPAAQDDDDDTLARADGYEIDVFVDDNPLIEGALVNVTEPVESRYAWRSREEDPIILTPRESGVEVLVDLSAQPRKKKNGLDFQRWECWLYVVR